MSENPSDNPQGECEFTAENLSVSLDNIDFEFDANCSRPVWDGAERERCVWHSEVENKPSDDLNRTVGDGDLAGSIARDMNLRGIDFPPDSTLIDADLSNSDLSECKFSNIDSDESPDDSSIFNHANLSDADLRHSDFTKCFFSNANLRGADLFNADLPSAVLDEADLRDADLQVTDLSDAVLAGSDLRKAYLRGTNLTGVYVNRKTKIKSRFYGLCTEPSSTQEWDDLAQGYYNLKQRFSSRGISSKAQSASGLHQRARAREALSSGYRGIYPFLSTQLSRVLTGYGTRPLYVLFWSVTVILACYLTYIYAGNRSPLYYSIVTFTTSPPWPPSVFTDANTNCLVRAIVLFQTFFGTVLTVLLGYVLSNRARL